MKGSSVKALPSVSMAAARDACVRRMGVMFSVMGDILSYFVVGGNAHWAMVWRYPDISGVADNWLFG